MVLPNLNSLRHLSVLCVSAVKWIKTCYHRRDAEAAEKPRRTEVTALPAP